MSGQLPAIGDRHPASTRTTARQRSSSRPSLRSCPRLKHRRVPEYFHHLRPLSEQPQDHSVRFKLIHILKLLNNPYLMPGKSGGKRKRSCERRNGSDKPGMFISLLFPSSGLIENFF